MSVRPSVPPSIRPPIFELKQDKYDRVPSFVSGICSRVIIIHSLKQLWTMLALEYARTYYKCIKSRPFYLYSRLKTTRVNHSALQDANMKQQYVTLLWVDCCVCFHTFSLTYTPAFIITDYSLFILKYQNHILPVDATHISKQIGKCRKC